MVATRVLNGTYREVWQESTATNFDGGTAVAITTSIRVDRTAAPVTTWLSDCKAEVRLTSKTGNPIVTTPVLSMNANGLLVVTFSNAAGTGNNAAYTLDVMKFHSSQQGVDGTYNGTGIVVDALMSSSLPATGTTRLYVDGTAGDDNANGASWATAWKTATKVQSALNAIFYIEPDALTVEVFVRGTFTTGLTITTNCRGTSRVFVGQHVDDMTSTNPGTVSAVGGEAPAPKHGMERLTLAGSVLDGTEIGKTLLLLDPVTPANRITATIVRVDVANQYVWVNRAIGSFPVWVAASPANVTVRVSSSQFAGEINFDTGSGVRQVATFGGVASGLFNLRCNSLATYGGEIVAAGCYVRSAAGVWGTIVPLGRSFLYYNGYTIPDSVGSDYGLFGGATLGTTVTLGCAGGDVYVLGNGSYVNFRGYLSGDLVAQEAGVSLYGTFCTFRAAIAYNEGAWVSVGNFIARGTASYALYSTLGGMLKVMKVSFLDLPGTGVAALFSASVGGEMRVGDANLEGNNTGSGTCRVASVVTGGVIHFQAAIPDTLKAKTTQLSVDGGTIFTVGHTMSTAREGVGPDNYVRDGTLSITGNVVKSAVNTAPSAVVQVMRGGKIVQVSGNFTLPAGSGNYTTDYGALGAIVANDGLADIRLGTLTGGTGATINIGCTLKNGARLVHAGAGLSGLAAPLDLGGSGAVAWPAAALTDNAAVTPQGCLIIANA